MPSSADHSISYQSCPPPGGVREVQVIPSGEVMIEPPRATAAKRFNSGDQISEYHCAVAASVLEVHVMPSGEVMTRVPAAPLSEVAQNSPSALAHTTRYHWLAAAAVLTVQVMPSGEVCTRLVPSNETATNSLSSGDQQTEVQRFACAAAAAVHVTPSLEYMTRFVPLDAIAKNILSSGAHVTSIHWFDSGIVLTVQVATARTASADVASGKFADQVPSASRTLFLTASSAAGAGTVPLTPPEPESPTNTFIICPLVATLDYLFLQYSNKVLASFGSKQTKFSVLSYGKNTASPRAVTPWSPLLAGSET